MEHLLDALLTVFIPAAAVLLAAAVYCLLPGRVACEPKSRRALGWVLVLFLAVSLLQLTGEFTLAMFGLAWRPWVCGSAGATDFPRRVSNFGMLFGTEGYAPAGTPDCGRGQRTGGNCLSGNSWTP